MANKNKIRKGVFTMKKILSLCLAIITLLSCVCVVNASENVVSSENPDFSYVVKDGEAWITNYTGTATELTLPTILDGYDVVGIDDFSFNDNKNIVSLVVPGNIKNIGQCSMSNWSALEKVVFEEGVETIGWESFYYCELLVEVDFPESLKKINAFAFHNSGIYYAVWDEVNNIKAETGKSPLTGVYIDKWLITFVGRDQSQMFNVAEGTVGIGCGSFSMVDPACFGIYIPSTVKHLDPGSVDGPDIRSIIVDENNPYYKSVDGVLYDKTVERVITYPRKKEDSVYEMPETVKYVETRAFNQNYYVEKIIFSKNVEDVFAPGLCAGMWKIKAFEVAEGNKNFASLYGVLYSADLKTLVSYPSYKEGKTFKIPNGVTTILNGAFCNNKYIKELFIADTVTTIEDYAFSSTVNVYTEEFSPLEAVLYSPKNEAVKKYAETHDLTIEETLLNNKVYFDRQNGLIFVDAITISSDVVVNHLGTETQVTNKNGDEIESTNLGTGVVVKTDDVVYTVVMKGDVDGSGNVNSTDYLRLKKIFLGYIAAPEGIYMYSADMDQNEKIDSTDYLQIKKIFLGTYHY